jgi:translation initiation factor 2B subunit (eIF-2B alpha/beta/delta family)
MLFLPRFNFIDGSANLISMINQDQLRRDILADNVRGSTPITADAVALLCRMLNEGETESRILSVAREISQTHCGMASLINLSGDLETLARRRGAGHFSAYLQSFLARVEKSAALTATYAAALLASYSTIVTLSQSSLVEAAIGRLTERPRLVFGESRPLNEGLPPARRLAKMGFPVTIVADAALPGFLVEGAAAVVGCDALLPTVLVNKIGTYPLALACRDRGAPLLVLGPRLKRLSTERAGWFAIRERPAAELGVVESENLRVRNIYFDLTPRSLITHLIGEDGPEAPCRTGDS